MTFFIFEYNIITLYAYSIMSMCLILSQFLYTFVYNLIILLLNVGYQNAVNLLK